MATQIYTAVPNDVITAARWNNEFGNIYNNALFGTIIATGSTTSRSIADRFGDFRSVKDFGATGNGTTDDTTAIQACIDSFTAGGGVVWFPDGIYKVTTTLTIAEDAVVIRGEGVRVSIISFQPTTSSVVCLNFTKGGADPAITTMCGIKDISISSTGNTQDGKVALNLEVQEEFWVENFEISDFRSTASLKDCVGIRHRGWQLNQFRNLFVYADIPLDIQRNPTYVGGIQLDLDFCIFEHAILAPATTRPACRIEDGCFVSNVQFSEVAFVGGTNGFEWNDVARAITGIADNGAGKCRVTVSAGHNWTASDNGKSIQIFDVVGTTEANVRTPFTYVSATQFDLGSINFVNAYVSGGNAYWSPGNSYMLEFSNCRVEQRDSTSAWCFQLKRYGSPLEAVSFNDTYFDPTCHGIQFRNIRKVSFSGVALTGAGKVIIDALSVAQASIWLENCFISTTAGTTALLPGYRQVMGAVKYATNSPVPSTGVYVHDTGDRAGVGLFENDDVRHVRGTIEDDGHVALPIGTSPGNTISMIRIAARAGTTAVGGLVMVDATGAASEQVTVISANTDGGATIVNTDTDVNICVQYVSPSFITIKNRLGAQCTFLAEVHSRVPGTISATNLNAGQTFVHGTGVPGTPLDLTDIVITDTASLVTGVRAELRMSTSSAGTISTTPSGEARPSFASGLWQVWGSVTDVNACLASAVFTPAADFNTTFNLFTAVYSCGKWDGAYGTKIMTAS